MNIEHATDTLFVKVVCRPPKFLETIPLSILHHKGILNTVNTVCCITSMYVYTYSIMYRLLPNVESKSDFKHLQCF